ncbi:MAG: hypothetical protein R3293_00200 [Candidatus Promineifilaceae bacterium]|nr:hypothetical protein [Candidatus Promineifilaceae bacterium]
MLALITSYWFVTLPGVLTGIILLKAFSKAHAEKEAKKRVPATIRKRNR